ncbi:BlaI/MecI/CopY family transcriptional regulator [Streptococcus chenjunshii]|uniref:BlaI/MecI/CopY family transcriptional regulator n=1 Tax=Streptococcus chenjunshii TaxID=2173853 RepID=A0A372KKT8_9STRE|nr:BlaI/MecI/CopY family transcriptional regulator [Streptococcus chenjunshii]AXQ79374.1 BlaI/MecI/CopY family transcriptional regulator [Streptococcus chenjunshii]RFU50570.1 BlaI/MecI/CopY family transcriptional regulator [Streptococcus chenjunshii]RFU52899.1 BlaI/MecI/CopY family transcriptional regulator [Streptococcus chenjunshii]
MKAMKRLPDAEFTVLKAIWHLPNPVTSSQIIGALGDDNHWKRQTLLTILARLIEKGFLSSERKGREGHYTALISEEEYMEVEAGHFFSRYEGQSFGHLMKSFFATHHLSEKDINDINQLIQERKQEK